MGADAIIKTKAPNPQTVSLKQFKPGLVTIQAAIVMVVLCGLDLLCLLPHPVNTTPPGAPVQHNLSSKNVSLSISKANSTRGQKCLPSYKVRANYHKRLWAWAERVKPQRYNTSTVEAVILDADRPKTWPHSPACMLAAAAVDERESARVEARLQGSALMHCLLILRDWWVYGSLESFTPEAMYHQRLAKMEKAGAKSPDSDQVCLSLVDSSLRTNPHFDAIAEDQAEHAITYLADTVHQYVYATIVVVLSVFVFEAMSKVAISRRRRTKKENVD